MRIGVIDQAACPYISGILVLRVAVFAQNPDIALCLSIFVFLPIFGIAVTLSRCYFEVLILLALYKGLCMIMIQNPVSNIIHANKAGTVRTFDLNLAPSPGQDLEHGVCLESTRN